MPEHASETSPLRYSEPLTAEVVLSDPETGEALLRVAGGILRPGDILTFAYPKDGLPFALSL
jgi:hypothetical protein